MYIILMEIAFDKDKVYIGIVSLFPSGIDLEGSGNGSKNG